MRRLEQLPLSLTAEQRTETIIGREVVNPARRAEEVATGVRGDIVILRNDGAQEGRDRIDLEIGQDLAAGGAKKRSVGRSIFIAEAARYGSRLSSIQSAVRGPIWLISQIRRVDLEFHVLIEIIGNGSSEHLLGRERKAIGVGQRRLRAARVIIAGADF